MSWRAKTERMSYRHGNHHKRPGKVLSQEGLTKQNAVTSYGQKAMRLVLG